jgi:hypothetical protein
MPPKHNLLLALALLLVLPGCASGPRFAEVRDTVPPLAPGNGRIYFYRTMTMGAAVQPPVKLDGTKVGIAKPRGLFFVDRPPGSYQIETSTEVSRRLSLTLEDQQIRYVRLKVTMGFAVGHVSPELVEPSVGELEIQKCRLISAEE